MHEFRLVCSDGSTNCVPQCDSRLHGDLLLLAVNGEDSKYSCEFHHGQHSWIGPAAEGWLRVPVRALSGDGRVRLTLTYSDRDAATKTVQVINYRTLPPFDQHLARYGDYQARTT